MGKLQFNGTGARNVGLHKLYHAFTDQSRILQRFPAGSSLDRFWIKFGRHHNRKLTWHRWSLREFTYKVSPVAAPNLKGRSG